MSQYNTNSGGGGGGTPITTLTGNAGSATGASILISGGTTGLTTSAAASTVTLTGTLDVANGGTGDSSLTAYAVLTGGTTSTNPVQSLAALGSAGDVLTSNGAGALPSFQAAGASLTGYTAVHGTALGVGTGVTGGDYNTFVGWDAGAANATGTQNTCVGAVAGAFLSSGANNIFVGLNAGKVTDTGSGNVNIGVNAGQLTNSASNNVIIGYNSGQSYTTSESNNIVIGQNVGGIVGESNALHIGDTGGSITTAFIGGIALVTVANSAAVLIDTVSGQLGTIISSARFKENIEDIGSRSEFIYKLRPVSFTLKSNPEFGVQTGLIAEEVQQVAPQLVALDKEGLAATVAYHELPVLLLAELQKLKAEVNELRGLLVSNSNA